jgi:hypothetical protein
MADNVQFQSAQLATPASGTQVSTDEAASGHIQRVKLAYSADGVDTHVQADSAGLLVNLDVHKDTVGDVMSATDQAIAVKSAIFGYTTAMGGSFEPVKVTPSGALNVEATITDGSGPVTVDGTVAATQSGTWTFGLPAGASTEFSLALLGSNFAAVKSGSNILTQSTISLNQTRITVQPVVSTTPAYTAKDAVGGKLTFTNAARTSGGSITIQTAVVVDRSQQMPVLELVLFDRDFTASNDNAAFDPTDADLAYCVGVIKISDYSDFSDNAVAVRTGIGLTAKLEGTDLYGQLVTRSAPTFVATTDIVVALTIVRD